MTPKIIKREMEMHKSDYNTVAVLALPNALVKSGKSRKPNSSELQWQLRVSESRSN